MSRVIRPAEPRDAAALGRVHVECWREAYAHLLSAELLAGLDPLARGEGWSRMLAHNAPDERVSVLEVDGELRGFASSGPCLDDDAPRAKSLYAIYLYADEHGSGAGQALLDSVIADEPAALWIADGNPRAEAFYRRNGFERDGTEKSEPRLEELLEVRMVR